MSSARNATDGLDRIGQALSPVAADLRDAAPDLTTALRQLPETTNSLRGLLPSLDGTLVQAPSTVDRIPALSADVRQIVPQLRTALSNLNPMLGYLQPYGYDLAAFFVNFGSILQYKDEAGVHFTRLLPALGNEDVVKGVPVKLPDILTYTNAYPAPGGALNPGPGGEFTRLYPEPK